MKNSFKSKEQLLAELETAYERTEELEILFERKKWKRDKACSRQ